MGKRRKSREIAMQMLFQSDLGSQNAEEVQRTFWQAREKVDPGHAGICRRYLSRRRWHGRKRSTPTLPRPASTGAWSGWRRWIATCCGAPIAEMLAYPATPLPIIINESLEIARHVFGAGIDPFLERHTGCGGARIAAHRQATGAARLRRSKPRDRRCLIQTNRTQATAIVKQASPERIQPLLFRNGCALERL